MQQALDDVRWMDRGIPPHVVDEIPWRRLLSMEDVYSLREEVQRELADQQEHEADKERLDREHAEKMAAQGLTPGGQPLRRGG